MIYADSTVIRNLNHREKVYVCRRSRKKLLRFYRETLSQDANSGHKLIGSRAILRREIAKAPTLMIRRCNRAENAIHRPPSGNIVGQIFPPRAGR